MAIDLSWSPLFIPSISCWGAWCDHQRQYDHNFRAFNSSLSTTYTPTTQTENLEYANMIFNGQIANDTFSFGSIKIKEQPFLEATDISPETFVHWYFNYSGVIGLSYGEENLTLPSPWRAIVDQKLLDRNIFSIELPQGPRDLQNPRTNGALTIGGVNPKHAKAEFLDLPLAPGLSWSVEVSSLSWGNDSFLHQNFAPGACTALFSATSTSILLPGYWASEITKKIGAKDPNGFFLSFPCENRNFLPNLIFTFGSGDKVSMSPFEYSFEMIGGNLTIPECMVGFERGRENRIVLGWPFLQNFVSVFDHDEKVVSRKFPSCLKRDLKLHFLMFS
jgi:hypothetical protein